MRNVGKDALYRRAVSSARREDGNNAMNANMESTLVDALSSKVLENENARLYSSRKMLSASCTHESIFCDVLYVMHT